MIQISLVVFIHQSSIAYVNKLMQTMPCNTCNQCQFDSCYPLVLRTALCPIGMCVSTLTRISTSRTVVDMRRLPRGACAQMYVRYNVTSCQCSGHVCVRFCVSICDNYKSRSHACRVKALPIFYLNLYDTVSTQT